MKLSIPSLALLSLATALSAAPVQAQIKIGAMVSATGPTSAIGIPQRNSVALLPTTVGGMSIEYITLDDGGDTTRAVPRQSSIGAELPKFPTPSDGTARSPSPGL